ncbi:MAG: hypothetical protein FWC06_07275 [Treponema sp.]|nr:hypothetical protein [Treponema sp.]
MNKAADAKQLRITLITGFILLLLALGAFVFFYLTERSHTAVNKPDESFQYLLNDWDAVFKDLFFTDREFDHLNNELDSLEKKALSVESWLSIIKRRRALADIHPPSAANYRRSIDGALKAYPSSQPVIALAVSSIIKNSAVNREAEDHLRSLLSLFTDPGMNNLRLAVHVILGDLGNPQKAEAIPQDILSISSLRFYENKDTFSDEEEVIFRNMIILKTLRRDFTGAFADIQTLLKSPSVKTLGFAAEYYYDFGDLLRSAEIFSHLSEYTAIQGLTSESETEVSSFAMIRQSDALYLAGYEEAAAGIWKIMAESNFNEVSLYNLAVTAEDQNTALLYLEKLVKNNALTKLNRLPSLAGQYGLIRYSRFLDNSGALALLQSNPRFPQFDYPYIDLEICKLYAQEQNLGRQLAETWLLLDRHERNEDLYKWAAWHFFFQRRFDEAGILFDRIDQFYMSYPWTSTYKAVKFMNEGYLEWAEHILRSIPPQDADWTHYANLGRLMEALHSPSRALENYEIAAAMVKNPKTASRIYVNMARCFSALNRPNDARHSLQYAVNLDSDNHAARLELDR